MNNFQCDIAANRIDCTWDFNGTPKSRSFTLSEIMALPDMTDNAFITLGEDANGDLTDPINLVKRHHDNLIDPTLCVYSTISGGLDGMGILLPFRDAKSFQNIAVFPGSRQRFVSFWKHWYQPVVLTDAIVPVGSKEKTVFIKALLNTEFTNERCHMTAALTNAQTSKGCSEFLSKTLFDVVGETSLVIDTSKMKDKDVHVLRVRSEYSASLSGPACCNVILRVRSDV